MSKLILPEVTTQEPGLLIAHSSSLVAEISSLTQSRRMNRLPQTHYGAVPKAWNKQAKEKSLLLAEAESLNNRFVALGVVFFEVVEQAATLADQHEKAAA
jgi:hypothetical protein